MTRVGLGSAISAGMMARVRYNKYSRGLDILNRHESLSELLQKTLFFQEYSNLLVKTRAGEITGKAPYVPSLTSTFLG